jgi:SAM-dependent methyltransferase
MNNAVERPSDRITSLEYWESGWRAAALPTPFASTRKGSSHLFRLLDRQFRQALVDFPAKDSHFIEIGCGASRWLPYFCRELGFSVSGIDYSPTGCASCQEILRLANVCGDIRQGDMFAPPPEWLERFDVVGSFGLVEHFQDTAAAVAACAAYLRPGGYIITLVPTMRGLFGMAYRFFNRPVYDTHFPLSAQSLALAHQRAGLEVVSQCHLLGLPGVIDDGGDAESAITLRSIVRHLSRGYWWLEGHGLGIPPNGFTSPYALCIARKPVV